MLDQSEGKSALTIEPKKKKNTEKENLAIKM